MKLEMPLQIDKLSCMHVHVCVGSVSVCVATCRWFGAAAAAGVRCLCCRCCCCRCAALLTSSSICLCCLLLLLLLPFVYSIFYLISTCCCFGSGLLPTFYGPTAASSLLLPFYTAPRPAPLYTHSHTRAWGCGTHIS